MAETFILVRTTDGKQAEKGEPVVSFRNEPGTLLNWYEPGTSAGGRGGRVEVRDDMGRAALYFPSAFGFEFRQTAK